MRLVVTVRAAACMASVATVRAVVGVAPPIFENDDIAALEAQPFVQRHRQRDLPAPGYYQWFTHLYSPSAKKSCRKKYHVFRSAEVPPGHSIRPWLKTRPPYAPEHRRLPHRRWHP